MELALVVVCAEGVELDGRAKIIGRGWPGKRRPRRRSIDRHGLVFDHVVIQPRDETAGRHRLGVLTKSGRLPGALRKDEYGNGEGYDALFVGMQSAVIRERPL